MTWERNFQRLFPSSPKLDKFYSRLAYTSHLLYPAVYRLQALDWFLWEHVAIQALSVPRGCNCFKTTEWLCQSFFNSGLQSLWGHATLLLWPMALCSPLLGVKSRLFLQKTVLLILVHDRVCYEIYCFQLYLFYLYYHWFFLLRINKLMRNSQWKREGNGHDW